MVRSLALLAVGALALAGCALFQRTDPPRVTLVGVEPAASEGLEARMQLKLRVQNPNSTAIDYRGVSVELGLQGKSFASGVSNESGTIPAFGEALIAVPVSVSILGIASRAMGMLGNSMDKIKYDMQGKLNSPTSGAVRFKSEGEVSLSSLMSGG
jgi:LEA14-like dessication related protein